MLTRLRTCLLLVCFGASFARAEQLPLWEAGVGIGAANIPHYRGSNQSKTWVFPVPYLIYRGDLMKVEEQRLHGLFFKTDKVELDLSLNGSPPARDNDARRGMPDLDATFEFGPSIDIFLFRSPDRKQTLELRLPARMVVATDFSHVDQVGWIFQPSLNLDFRDVLENPGWKLGLRGSLIYADRRYNQYFYAVDPMFATTDRPAFSSGGGYAGTAVVAAISKRFPGFWVGGFSKWDNVGGAVFADSPLVKTKHNFTAGFGISWILDASAEKVEAAHY
jgi:outer membrane scaffolding protein for murein synthesis (MipA/OmpV family)